MRSHRSPTLSRTSAALAAALLLSFAPARAQTTTRESVDSNAVQANNDTSDARGTPDGRYLLFTSHATNLVTGDTNSQPDAFLRDLSNATTTRVTVDATGAEGNGPSGGASISADARYVAFESGATNLLASDTNNATDIYVKDLQTGALVRANLRPGGAQTNSVSMNAKIAAGGRFVLFESLDTGLVSGDTNGKKDVFVHDLVLNTTERINVDPTGADANAEANGCGLSADGRYALFFTTATNLVAGDANGFQDVFLRDRQTGQTAIVSLDSNGMQANDHCGTGSMSADGRFVAFESRATNLVAADLNGQFDVFVRDLKTGVTTLVSTDAIGTQGNSFSLSPVISAGGRFVAFSSLSSNLVAGDTNSNNDAFLRDLHRGTLTRLSVSTAGVGGNFGSFPSYVSADGGRVAFVSECTNLVGNDTNSKLDVYLRDRGPEAPLVYCTAKQNSQGCTPAIAASGSPSAAVAAPFLVTASSVINRRNGLAIYGFGSDSLPFHGGTLCVKGPLRFTPMQKSGGNPPPEDCSGSFSLDFNARIQSGVDGNLVLGRTVYCQYWYRDHASTSTTGLTDALRFVVGP